MKRLSILVLLVLHSLLNAQDEQVSVKKMKRAAPFSVRGTIGIPRTISSSMFRTAFNGVYEWNASVNARVFGNVSVGAGFQNTHFQNNKEVFKYKTWVDKNGNATGQSLSFNTRLNCKGIYMRVGYDKFLEKSYVSYVLNMGYMLCDYKNLNSDTTKGNKPLLPTSFGAPYIQPEIAINFLTDGRLTFSLLFSYGTMLTKFDARAPRFNNFEEIYSKKNKYMISWINLGFGFNVLLGDL